MCACVHMCAHVCTCVHMCARVSTCVLVQKNRCVCESVYIHTYGGGGEGGRGGGREGGRGGREGRSDGNIGAGWRGAGGGVTS